VDYGEVIKSAWKISWKFKVLWIFGILAGCGQGQSGNYNFNNTFQTGANGSSSGAPNLPPGLMEAFNSFVNRFEDPAFVWRFAAAAVAALCIILVVEIFLSTIGRIGLIKGSAEADGGAEKLTFGGLWRESTPYFWRVFWLTLLLGGPIAVAAILAFVGLLAAFLPLATNNQNLSTVLIFVPAVCLFLCLIIIIAILVGFVSTQAERAIILENKSVVEGVRRGCAVLTGIVGPILIFWLISSAIAFAAGIVIVLPLLVILAPLAIAFMAAMNNVNFSYTPWIVAFVCIICVYIPLSWLANGILMTYLHSLWTLTYLRLTQAKDAAGAPEGAPANA